MSNHPQILTFPAKRDARLQRPKVSRLWMAVLAVYWTALIVGTHVPRLPRVAESHGFDKVLHFTAYAGLALLVGLVLRGRRAMSLDLVVKVVAVMALVGAIDEITQPLFGRDCELLDWCADVTGAIVGISALAALLWARGARRVSSWDQAA